MASVSQTYKAACHCGSVQFDVELSEDLKTARRCTCSICTMRGAVAVSAELAGMTFTQGEELLTLYTFNTHQAKHYFCSKCGTYTHHQRRSNPNQYGINVACLEGVSPFDFEEVVVFDGQKHTADTKQKAQIAGVLRFEKS
jgi:hypothetical protein